MLYRLSYAHHYSSYTTTTSQTHTMCAVARPAGFEPATTRLEGGCSIQLSYGRRMHIVNPEGLKCWSLNRLPNRLRCVCEAGRIILSPHLPVNDEFTFFSNI